MFEENTGNFSSAKTKHDWYQNNSNVTITVLIRNLNENDVNISFTSDSLSCVCKLSDGTQYDLHLNLFKPIVVSQSSWKLSVSKLEITLKKQESIRWSNLEAIPTVAKNNKKSTECCQSEVKSQQLVIDNEKDEKEDQIRADNENKSINSSETTKCLTFQTKNWDKIVQELEKEEEEDVDKGEGSVDQLFKRIYEKGGEEVRRAMNKSFTESGGTVLSTNWGEVSKSKVEVKAPDGCEHKQWN